MSLYLSRLRDTAYERLHLGWFKPAMLFHWHLTRGSPKFDGGPNNPR